ncbi:hypothetical protein P280DRAFT_314161 [Massarina eburnea CBS 473.64]|uniref:Uncharacterized protein n=1 Tax=Massarina eburnea CBS 473.64 TaxID=1395130 RepID=A0A6A6S305_9PLEO|nr:hypothetical protein P280DRAFT_314161 [Massarina eburnea CBS 473.64]
MQTKTKGRLRDADASLPRQERSDVLTPVYPGWKATRAWMVLSWEFGCVDALAPPPERCRLRGRW